MIPKAVACPRSGDQRTPFPHPLPRTGETPCRGIPVQCTFVLSDSSPPRSVSRPALWGTVPNQLLQSRKIRVLQEVPGSSPFRTVARFLVTSTVGLAPQTRRAKTSIASSSHMPSPPSTPSIGHHGDEQPEMQTQSRVNLPEARPSERWGWPSLELPIRLLSGIDHLAHEEDRA